MKFLGIELPKLPVRSPQEGRNTLNNTVEADELALIPISKKKRENCN